jgi:hypothetical protein
MLILEGGESGTFSILEDWTDKATPTGGSTHLLWAPALLELVELVRQLKGSGGSVSKSQKGVDRWT